MYFIYNCISNVRTSTIFIIEILELFPVCTQYVAYNRAILIQQLLKNNYSYGFSPYFPRDKSFTLVRIPLLILFIRRCCTRPIINHDVWRGPLTTAAASTMWRSWARVNTRVCVRSSPSVSAMVGTTSQSYTHAYTTGGGGQGAGGEMRVLINWLLIARPAHINDRRICFLYIYLACIYTEPPSSRLSVPRLFVKRSTFLAYSSPFLCLSRARKFWSSILLSCKLQTAGSDNNYKDTPCMVFSDRCSSNKEDNNGDFEIKVFFYRMRTVNASQPPLPIRPHICSSSLSSDLTVLNHLCITE